jgi:hypothetical protein
MRVFGKMFVLATCAVAAASMVAGQPPGGGFGQFGGKGKGGGNDYWTLLKNAGVKDELKLSDQQAEKLPAALQKALAEVLNDKQLHRLHEIYLQQRGNSAFLDPEIKKDLKISNDQAQKIKDALDSMAKDQAEMFQGGNFDFEKIQELQKSTTDKINGLLTQEQKTAWTKMQGQPFEMKGGFGFKKKD